MHEMADGNMVDIVAAVNQGLLDVAEWAGVSVWLVIATIAVALLNHIFLLILFLYWIKWRRGPSIKVSAAQEDAGGDELELVERTLAEFPADQIKIETTKGKVVLKLVSTKPMTVKEPLLPQEIKGEPLPSKVEESKSSEPDEPESEPIPMKGRESTPEKQETK
ncbi:MAG: hypothetical protein V3V36_03605 [Candidatus Hydrothermarchaeaceae archaeon]